MSKKLKSYLHVSQTQLFVEGVGAPASVGRLSLQPPLALSSRAASLPSLPPSRLGEHAPEIFMFLVALNNCDLFIDVL